MKPKIIHLPRNFRPRPPPRRPIRWPWVRMLVMALAGLTLIVTTTDFGSLRIRAGKTLDPAGGSSLVSDALVEVTTATNRYVDFAGRFSTAWPPNWAAYPFRQEGDYAVTLRGPHRMELNIMVLDIGDGGQAAVQAALRLFEVRQRIHVPTEEIVFQGRPAYRRRLPLGTITVEAIDFAAGRQHFHIAASAPRTSFDDLRPVLVEMMERVTVNEMTRGYPKTDLAPGGLVPPEPTFASPPQSHGTSAPATQGRGGRPQGFGIDSNDP